MAQRLGSGPLGQVICENNFKVDPWGFSDPCLPEYIETQFDRKAHQAILYIANI
jgi:hypothetical protein